MKSFYGGPAGQSFEIKKIFTSYNKNGGNGLLDDLAKTWHSPVGVGEYVIISYGAPNTEQYKNFLKLDLANQIEVFEEIGKDLADLGFTVGFDDETQTALLSASFNGTLWQKAYSDERKAYGGVYYKLITSWISNTPLIEVSQVVLDANKEPWVEINTEVPDNPTITFHLPHSWDFAGTVVVEEPALIENQWDEDGNRIYPKMWLEDTSTSHKETNEKGEEIIVIDSYQQTFHYKPIAVQEIEQVEQDKLDADQQPTVTFYTSGNTKSGAEATRTNPIIEFGLPQTPKYTVAIIDVDSTQDPDVELDQKDTNNRVFRFTLPAGVKFYSGDKLGKSTDYKAQTGDFNENMIKGDYYINSNNGFIYQVTNKSENDEFDFKYVTCLQPPAPDIAAMPIPPYTQKGESYEATEPRAEIIKDETTNTWTLNLDTVKAPLAEIVATFIGASEQGSVDVKPNSADTLLFSFDIPQGSRWFTGTQVSVNGSTTKIDEVKPGDIYLNTGSGDVFLWKDNNWLFQGNIKGIQGDALNIVASYELNANSKLEDGTKVENTEESIGKYIDENYSPDIRSQDLFGVNWVGEDDNTYSYWFYKLSGSWHRETLTGGIGGLLSQDFDSASPENKTYSISYIQNKMIGDDDLGKNDTIMNNTAYSKAQIVEKFTQVENSIEEKLSWGNFDELD